MKKVIVRIWSDGRLNSPGHVSLEIPDQHYISFWPDDPDYFNSLPERRLSEVCVHRIPEKGYLATLAWDHFRYNQQGYPCNPIEEYTLYSLNTVRMSERFEAFKASSFEWNLLNSWGHTLNNRQAIDPNAIKSCSGLAAWLLDEGGINDLLSQRARYINGALAGVTGAVIIRGLWSTGRSLWRTIRSSSIQPARARFAPSTFEAPAQDGDTTIVAGLAGTGIISGTFTLVIAARDFFKELDPSTQIVGTIAIGAFVGGVCGHLRFTDSGPPAPHDIGKRARIAVDTEKQRSLQPFEDNLNHGPRAM